MTLAFPTEILLALVGFAVATSITPGPNNLMLLASGVNFGFRRSIGHMLGISIGFGILLIAVGFGLGALLERVPTFHRILQVVAVGYMLWLSWRVATAGRPSAGTATSRPLGFIGAAGFQWVNPKAWFMALTAMSLYVVPSAPVPSVLLVATVFTLVNLPCVSLWCAAGAALRGWLADPVRLRVFNLAMAALLLLSMWPLLHGGSGAPS